MTLEAQGLAERLGEVIEEYCEANQLSAGAILWSLEYVYACVERQCEDSPGWQKMH